MPKTLKPIDSKKLNESVKAKDYQAAKKLIDSFLDQEPSKEDKGKVYTDVVMLYMRTSNQINRTYLKQLEATTVALKAIDAGETEVNNALKILSVKKKLVETVDEFDE